MDQDPNSILNFLGARNLIRGVGAGLPSGPSIAKHLGIEVIDLDENEPAGLWFYILKEAEVTSGGTHLGPLGSLIIDAVFAGLLLGDPRSFYNLEPDWNPNDDPLLKPTIDNIDTGISDVWELASIIRISGLPIE
ncbi:MAG: hypothetical protein KTR23_02925 [Rhodospirillales bacterium]|nr:hypothetical protein [Rhodospirillales bacterium]